MHDFACFDRITIRTPRHGVLLDQLVARHLSGRPERGVPAALMLGHPEGVTTQPDERLSKALIAFLSGGTRPYPALDEDAVAAAVGEESAADLLPEVREIVHDAFAVPIDWLTHSYEPYVRVQDTVRAAHPELSEEAVMAVGRYWAYQMK